jgi:hypothetical protein
MEMKRYLPAIFLGLGLVTSAMAAGGDGGYAGAFLQVPIGARPTSMGGAYLAVSNDGAGILYNPAGLVTVKKTMFSSSYRFMTLDRKLGYVSILMPVEGESVLGFHWLYAGYGSVTARDDDGYTLDHDFSFNSHDFSAVFGKRFEKWIAAGAKLNYYHSRLPEVNAFSIGFDFGFMVYFEQLIDRERRETLPVRDLQAGLTVKYLSVKYPWNSQKYNVRYGTTNDGYEQIDKVPLEVGVGASCRLLKRKLLLATDVLKNEKQDVRFYGGAEYFVVPEFALRAGYGDKRLAAGTGYIFQLGKQVLAVDYAFSSDKAGEGSEHIFSFDLLF